MSRPNDFHAIWPPADDDGFDALPEVREAQRLFRDQMDCLGRFADQATRTPIGAETHYLSQEIAALLHNIGGTAAYFGKAEFGNFARDMEQPLRAAFTSDLLRPLCARITARLVAGALR
jgi:hypothetical protein